MSEMRSENGRFYFEEKGTTTAEVTFSPMGVKVISIDHTFVSPSLRGKGIAEQLIRGVISHARSENLKIIPSCSYAEHHFDKFPEDRDVLQ
ncbi:hypothetical protein SAMN05661091_3605 [Paenibacillus uliginis N3/975]|uniref:Uncharacterized protein n=1 Tax=Paenibacillus uliginis N3/975 TaxID=1313296 RepID=A0A1X7HJZ2_9BACL|nr:GNAT family N-acetyltransferase [Paenibacillus uliginis]SMF87052.1 hypothetical protein SAMN05661091_3605 [Paenibacillus uliginis N3/975]